MAYVVEPGGTCISRSNEKPLEARLNFSAMTSKFCDGDGGFWM
jgi:hypothetical protein